MYSLPTRNADQIKPSSEILNQNRGIAVVEKTSEVTQKRGRGRPRGSRTKAN